MAPSDADVDLARFDALAARLAPGVIDEAVAEAREVARGQLVRLLAQQITKAALAQALERPLEQNFEQATALAETGPELTKAPPRFGEQDPTIEDSRWSPDRNAALQAQDADRTQALYAYGIVPAGTPVSDLVGLVEGSGVSAVTRGRVALAASPVDPELLRDLDEDLSETGRLAELARRHDQVLRDLLDRGPVLPLRFGTVLPGAGQASDVLDDPRGDLPRALDALRNAREWGLRLDAPRQASRGSVSTAAPDAAAPDAAAPAGAAPGSAADSAGRTLGPAFEQDAVRPGTGAAYLTSRRDALREEERRRDETRRLIERAHRELLGHARDAARRTGRPDRAFDCAYLVDRSQEDTFLDAAERLGRELEDAGYVTTVTGPWPPYSFVHLTLGGDSEIGAGAPPPAVVGAPAGGADEASEHAGTGTRIGTAAPTVGEAGDETGEEHA